MASRDPDGRVAQVVGDMHGCLRISLYEALRDMRAQVEVALPERERFVTYRPRWRPDATAHNGRFAGMWAAAYSFPTWEQAAEHWVALPFADEIEIAEVTG
jgi:hypothetical protein